MEMSTTILSKAIPRKEINLKERIYNSTYYHPKIFTTKINNLNVTSKIIQYFLVS